MANSLLQNDITLHRYYMEEALDLHGIPARYYQIKPGHKFTVAGEIKAHYYDAVATRLLFDQVPKLSTLKLLGWVTELDQQQPIVHVAFDTPGLQVGCLYELRDPLTPDNGRLFRVTKMSVTPIYPAFVTCQLQAIIGTEPEETTEPYTGNHSVFLDRPEGEEQDVY